MRALRCRCGRHMEARDEAILLASLREHVQEEHLGGSRTGSAAGDLATEILTDRVYRLEYVPLPEDNELIPEAY